jgi:hypothetical protein
MANPEMGRKGLLDPDNLEGCRGMNVRILTKNVVSGILSRLKEEASNSMRYDLENDLQKSKRVRVQLILSKTRSTKSISSKKGQA